MTRHRPARDEAFGPREWVLSVQELSNRYMRQMVATSLLVVVSMYGVATAQPASVDARFKMARIRYSGGGDWYGNESSWANLLAGLVERTRMPTVKKEAVVSLRSNDIFTYPVVTISGHGTVSLSEDEGARLKSYLAAGGFLWADDDYGMDESFRPAIQRAVPEGRLVELPVTHPIYHCFYDLKDGLPKIHEHHGGPPRGYGMYIDGRMVMFYSHNTDIGDGLEDPDVHRDPPARREEAMRMAVNVVVYACTH